MSVQRVLRYPVDHETEKKCRRFWHDSNRAGAWLKYPDRWRWLYGAGAISVVVEEDETIVGHLGCIPVNACVLGRRRVWGMDLDLYVLREFRRRGYARLMQQRVLTEFENVLGVWHSDAMLAIKLSLGLVVAVQVPVFHLDRLASPHRPLAVVQRPPEALRIAREAERYLSHWDFYVERTEAYCAWRFEGQPMSNYRQSECEAGIALVRRCGPKYVGQGMIGDIYPSVDSAECARELVESVAAAMFMDGCSGVRFATADCRLIEALSSRGWNTVDAMQLTTSPGTVQGRAFISLSDHDVDQYPW